MALVLAVAAFAVAAAGCGGETAAPPAPTIAAAPVASPAPTAAVAPSAPTAPPALGAPSVPPAPTAAVATPPSPAPTAQLAPVATPASATPASPDPNYDPTATMYRAFPKVGYEKPDFEQAVADILRERDTSQVPVLVEALRFYFDAERQELAASTLRSLTGQNFDRLQWDKWMEWYGANREHYRPPEGYAAWKANLLSFIDDGYIELLADADETSRIDLTEVVWGGVPIDGIPDLRDPDVVPADDAHYLLARDRVFGVSINGEHRAYPLRITNPHEMVNDVLGGEPIALAW